MPRVLAVGQGAGCRTGTRRRTAARIVLGPSRSLRTSGRSTSRKRGNGRVTTPTAADGSMASRHRRHDLPSSRTRPRASPGSRHPQPRDYTDTAVQTRIFSVRSTQYAEQPSIPFASRGPLLDSCCQSPITRSPTSCSLTAYVRILVGDFIKT